MYGCESWTVKKAECQRTDAFELWCWRRLLRVPWTARRFNQAILKEINPENSLRGLMLKFQYFGHLMWRADSFERTALKRVLSYVKQITSPGSMHETGCSGLVHLTQRDGMGNEATDKELISSLGRGGSGFTMGNTCKPTADSCQYMAKTTTVL